MNVVVDVNKKYNAVDYFFRKYKSSNKGINIVGMKKMLVFLTFVCMLNTFSCISKKESTREDVWGLWEATKSSLEKQKQNKIFSFQLNADSTAIIIRDNISQEEMEGIWLWKYEKKWDNNNSGIGITSDVRLKVSYDFTLMMRLEERAGDLYLQAGEYQFKKKK